MVQSLLDFSICSHHIVVRNRTKQPPFCVKDSWNLRGMTNVPSPLHGLTESWSSIQAGFVVWESMKQQKRKISGEPKALPHRVLLLEEEIADIIKMHGFIALI